MSLEIAEKAVDWLWGNPQKARRIGAKTAEDKCSINFFGGEPLLMWD